MILFPPAKLNLGLHILFKRKDAYHEIDTIMVETPFTDVLEITPAEQDEFIQTGIEVPSDGTPNLCQKALNRLRLEKEIPPVRIHLRKQIPVGAGLGGGSADASFTLKGLNELFELGYSDIELESFAAELGSDCPFFIRGGLQRATGRGELLSKLPALHKKYWLVLLNPGIHVSTAVAYSNVLPDSARPPLDHLLKKNDISLFTNDFETFVFQEFPAIEQMKMTLSDLGAIYAAMSGSGSSVFGLFDQCPNLPNSLTQFAIFQGDWEI
ncbi:MAG: hypothetical protein RLZZ65_455 [Bacteroidota bacterium]|jgi:4-diphosphocytidyl-2-C-methyl-D-erythritol kinase